MGVQSETIRQILIRFCRQWLANPCARIGPELQAKFVIDDPIDAIEQSYIVISDFRGPIIDVLVTSIG